MEQLRPQFEAFLKGRENRPEDEEAATRALERALVREGAALLAFKSYEIEPSGSYTHTSRDDIRFSRDFFLVGLGLRVGLPWDLQFDAFLPFGEEYRRDATGSRTTHGVGDPSFALSYHLLREQDWVPNVIATLDYKPAVGRNTTFNSATPVAIGSGFDSIGAGFTATKRRDPLVFFGGYSYLHNFDTTENGVELEPGADHVVRFGAAFAASPDTSLRASFNATFQESLRVNDVVTDRHKPIGTFELGGAMVLTERTVFDALVGIGVTNSAPDFRISVALPVRF